MEKIVYDMLYLMACGIHEIVPEKKQFENIDMEKLYKLSRFHLVEALVGMTLKKADIQLSKEWKDAVAKAIRKNILLDEERIKIENFMEQKGVWYMPLKGAILKELYPEIGMRQMSDNDILFDSRFSKLMQDYMTSQGYEAISIDKGNHDVYEKKPIYNFEMHKELYGENHQEKWRRYYKNVRERLIQNTPYSLGCHFSDEDFYVYMCTHAYKHYSGCGTGIRTLMDIYIYLEKKEQKMDFSYIKKECNLLGIAQFEEKSRKLCRKVFDKPLWKNKEELEYLLLPEEQKMLEYYLTSGVYGTIDHMVQNAVSNIQKETGKAPRFFYLWKRLFPGEKIYQSYLDTDKYKWKIPVAWLYRIFSAVFDKERRKRVLKEILAIKKIK